MGLVDSIIVSACTGLSGNALDACTKAIQAGAKQSGFEIMANTAEQKITKKAESEVRRFIGDTTFNAVGATAYLYQTAQTKALNVGIPTFGICNKAGIQIAPDKSLLNMEWKF